MSTPTLVPSRLDCGCEPVFTDKVRIQDETRISVSIRFCSLHASAPALKDAAQAAINHLEVCEAGKINHPFKSRSLPMLRIAVARSEGRKTDAFGIAYGRKPEKGTQK